MRTLLLTWLMLLGTTAPLFAQSIAIDSPSDEEPVPIPFVVEGTADPGDVLVLEADGDLVTVFRADSEGNFSVPVSDAVQQVTVRSKDDPEVAVSVRVVARGKFERTERREEFTVDTSASEPDQPTETATSGEPSTPDEIVADDDTSMTEEEPAPSVSTPDAPDRSASASDVRGSSVNPDDEMTTNTTAEASSAVRSPSQPWHPWTIAAQVGAVGVAGFINLFVLFGGAAAFDAATDYRYGTDFYSVEGLAVGTALSTAVTSTAVWTIGRLVGGPGSAWSIPVGTLAGSVLGVPLLFATGGGEGWLVGQLLAAAVTIPMFHLTYPRTPAARVANSPVKLRFSLSPSRDGASASIAGTF